MARKIEVQILGDSRSLERAFARSERAATRFTGKLSRTGIGRAGGMAGAFGVGIGGAALVSGIKGTVDAASDLNEEINKSQVVFGKSAAGILKWSKTSAQAFGLAQQQALEAAGAFGAMFETSGLAETKAASMSQTMVKLAADMASFNNEDPGEMLDKLRSGLAGEAEPLRRFGVLLSEARVKQEAYRLGIAKAGAALTESQKVLARYSLILGDTGRQQGDFARTSGGLANQQRTLKANITNISAVIGKQLLPAVLDTTKALNAWLKVPENQKKISDNAEKTATGLGKVKETLNAIYHLQFNRPPQWLEDMDRNFQQKVDGWRRAINRIAGVELAPLKGGILDMPGGGTFLPVKPGPRPDDRAGPFGPGPGKPYPTPVVPVPRGVTVGQKNTWFDAMVNRMLGDVQDVPTLKGQIAKLREIGRVVDERLDVTKDLTRRINLGEVVKDINRQIRADQQQLLNEAIAKRIEAKNRTLALAQKELDLQKKIREKQRQLADAIKSSLLGRLDQRQTTIDNMRQLRDAGEQLRLARYLGGRSGIREASEAFADARRRIVRSQVEAATFKVARAPGGGMTLTAGHVINHFHINGENAEQVARKVAEILKRQVRHTSTLSRGPAAGVPHGV